LIYLNFEQQKEKANGGLANKGKEFSLENQRKNHFKTAIIFMAIIAYHFGFLFILSGHIDF
jgi:hypothetical protein